MRQYSWAEMTLGALPSAAMTVSADDSGIYEQLELKKDELTGNVIRTSEDKDDSVRFDATGYFYDSTYTCTYTGANGGDFCTDRVNGPFPVSGETTVSHPADTTSGAEATSVTYQLPSYTGNDCYKFTKSSGTTTMHLQTLGAYDYIYVLAVAGGVGDSTDASFDITLNYTEGSEQKETFTLYDWFTSKTSTNAIALYEKVTRGDHADNSWRNCGSATAAPYLLSIKINADATRLLSSISFAQNESTTPDGVNCAVFAVTGAVSPSAPAAPVATAATDLDTDGSLSFTANWNAVSGADSYRIDVSEYSNFCDSNGNPSFVSGYNNYAVLGDGNTTSCTVGGLSEGKTYYYRVRAVSNTYGRSLSSNRILATLPQWVLAAGLDYEKVSYVETEDGALTLTINSNLTLTDTLMLPDGENVTIDLGGHTVIAPVGKPAVSAESEAKVSLTIADSSSGGGGKLTGSDGNGVGASGTAAQQTAPAMAVPEAQAFAAARVSRLMKVAPSQAAMAEIPPRVHPEPAVKPVQNQAQAEMQAQHYIGLMSKMMATERRMRI